jgi:hypothetical protein
MRGGVTRAGWGGALEGAQPFSIKAAITIKKNAVIPLLGNVPRRLNVFADGVTGKRIRYRCRGRLKIAGQNCSITISDKRKMFSCHKSRKVIFSDFYWNDKFSFYLWHAFAQAVIINGRTIITGIIRHDLLKCYDNERASYH